MSLTFRMFGRPYLYDTQSRSKVVRIQTRPWCTGFTDKVSKAHLALENVSVVP